MKMKKVILEPREKDVVLLNAVNGEKTYIAIFPSCDKFKLHRISSKYVFVSLFNSECWANGEFVDKKSAISRAIRDDAVVYEINNTADFIECLEMYS